MKYFIMAWDDDSEPKRYHGFYFVADEDGKLKLFGSAEDAESFGHKECKYFNVCSWHNYMVGDSSMCFKKLIMKLG